MPKIVSLIRSKEEGRFSQSLKTSFIYCWPKNSLVTLLSNNNYYFSSMRMNIETLFVRIDSYGFNNKEGFV